MKKFLFTGIFLLIIGAAVAGLSGVSLPSISQKILSSNPVSTSTESQALYVVPPQGETYKNDTYHFSLTLPQGFSAHEMAGSAEQPVSKTIVLEDTSSNGVQITVTPFDEDLHVLTKERIQQDVPDMQITDTQTLEVGNNYTGLAFKSNNPAFNGASREVWFVFRGNLYQISTYETLDPLLKNIFATWQFL